MKHILSPRVAVMTVFSSLCFTLNAAEAPRWSAEKANEWYARQPWLVGCNFGPSTAINQIEMCDQQG
jgi:hypothetical protein